VFKNKHQVVSQGNISLKLEARSSKEKTPSAQLSASSFQLSLCEHLQKPHNAGSRSEARFFNTLVSAAGEYRSKPPEASGEFGNFAAGRPGSAAGATRRR